MVERKAEGSLSEPEKKIVKRLLLRGWRNQDIQAMLNIQRVSTVNSARITEVKQNANQAMAGNDEVDFFLKKKESYDPQTGLNFYDDERLIRAREAMILAAQVFNSAGLRFKTEVFAVLANISWTYLLHEYYSRKGIAILGDDGRSLLLSQMINRRDSPLPKGVKNNLVAMKSIRDEVEHLLLGKSDLQWQGLYQACCLNFEKMITTLFGPRLSLAHELSFALQFSKVNFEQVSELNKFELPAHIQALDARLNAQLSDAEIKDTDYQFRVIYTFDASSKGRAHLEFVNPDSAEGKEISTILSKVRMADELYPHKPNAVCDLVRKKALKRFSVNNHSDAWKYFKVRPNWQSKNPSNTDKKYCIFHPAHKDYTYSDKWGDFLVQCMNEDEFLTSIKPAKT